MAITNKELRQTLDFITGKMEAEESFAKEHRAWEVIQIEKLRKKIDLQIGRVRENEVAIGKLKTITGIVSGIFAAIMTFLMKKTL